MTGESNVWWVIRCGARILFGQLYPSEEAAVRALRGRPDPSSGARDGAGAMVDRQRAHLWHVERVRVEPDGCALCGEPWVEGHECRRD
jgi:hypothetical protein